MLNLSLGYRLDWGASNLLIYSDEQKGRYGKQRLEYSLDYHTKLLSVREDIYYQLHFKLKGEVITDNLNEFKPNLNNSNKYRSGIHLFSELRPLRYRSIGFMLHGYYGRDYLNIRYDDIVVSIQAGITFSLQKYYPMGWRIKNTGGAK